MKATPERLVLRHATGRLEGLYQIVGTPARPASSIEDYPKYIAYGPNGLQTANYTKHTSRYILYTEG